MAEIIHFNAVIKALLDEKTPFPARYLNHFSDIDAENIKGLKEVWPSISIKRKQNLLEDLEDLLEKDTLLSFNDLAISLINDPEAEIRTLAIHLLWESEDIKLVPDLLRVLKSDTSSPTSAAAATMLGHFIYLGEMEKISPYIYKEIEENLLEVARSHSSPLVHRHAIEALGASSRPEVKDLIEFAYSSTDPEWKASALFAMGRSADQSWERKVFACLEYEDDLVRLEAIHAAGELSLASALSPLIRMLENEEDIDQHHAILWALSQIGGEEVQEKFDELLDITPDSEAGDFLEEAMENLRLTNELAAFTLLNLDEDSPGNQSELDQ